MNFRNSSEGNRRGTGQEGEKECRENRMGEEKEKETWSNRVLVQKHIKVGYAISVCVWLFVSLLL